MADKLEVSIPEETMAGPGSPESGTTSGGKAKKHHSVTKSIRKGAAHLFQNISNGLPSRGNISVPISPPLTHEGGGRPGMLKSFSFVAKHGGINTNSDIDTEKDDEFFSHLMTSDDLDIPDVVLPEPEMTAAQKAAKWFRETTSMREEDIESVRGVLDTLTVGLFMAVCTVVALFLTDINGMIGTRESDDNVSNCMFALFIIFILELTLESLVRPNYFSSMFFWLDILAIASMINDIPTAAGFVGLPRSTITARAGRVGRIVRIVRIVRLTRIGKLAKYPARIYKYLFPAHVASANAKARGRANHSSNNVDSSESGKYSALSSGGSGKNSSSSKEMSGDVELTKSATAAVGVSTATAAVTGPSEGTTNDGTHFEEDDDDEDDVVLEEDAGTLLSEMTQITISKIIAGIVIMLLALNYIGKIEEPYTPLIEVEDKLAVINHYFETVNVSQPQAVLDTQLDTLRLLNMDVVSDVKECYYFAYLNKTRYVQDGEVEYIVVKDATVTDVIEDINVRIIDQIDLHLITYPSGTGLLLDASYSYEFAIEGSGLSNDYSTFFQTPGQSYEYDYTDDMVSFKNTVSNPTVFIVKLNMHDDSVATAYGSLQVSLFMIGLILLWYVIYNAQAQALSDKICKPMEEMMVDMTSAAMLEFSDMKSIYLVKPDNDEEEDRIALLHEVKILDTDEEDVKLAKRKANSIVRYKKRRYQEHKDAIANNEMMLVEAQREASLYEVKQINKTFQNMASGLQAFSKYVPRDIVLEMLRGGSNTGLGVKPKEITIFFSDIEGFTTICDMMTPNDVLFMLSKYFKVMSNIISKLGGTLLEFIGDAILATWNAPGDVADHASGCIEASLQMQEALVAMCGNDDDDPADMTPEDSCYYWRVVRKYPVIKIRCGVHSGCVFVGNLGAPNRMKFGIMGDGVNLASRLEELNKKYATRIIISQNT